MVTEDATLFALTVIIPGVGALPVPELQVDVALAPEKIFTVHQRVT